LDSRKYPHSRYSRYSQQKTILIDCIIRSGHASLLVYAKSHWHRTPLAVLIPLGMALRSRIEFSPRSAAGAAEFRAHARPQPSQDSRPRPTSRLGPAAKDALRAIQGQGARGSVSCDGRARARNALCYAAARGGVILPHRKAVATVIGQASGVRQDRARPDSSRPSWTERMPQPIQRILFPMKSDNLQRKEIHWAIAMVRSYTRRRGRAQRQTRRNTRRSYAAAFVDAETRARNSSDLTESARDANSAPRQKMPSARGRQKVA
jgi:hypothetical protein